ncbi:hemagglutinin-related protein [Xenorhabdus beddingii]|uniref:Hemagglutinin-related protein n=1 Tax=Xenorhabdus beddingii TaxID=40578 RepID=A0A1Y2SDI6_9GAMM|nr:hemagglutinin repeat-containing protein [Xenorhabdus beddingii]OTA16719.1 hemagglutinin-related protein [Xenorhabdus beddingii]
MNKQCYCLIYSRTHGELRVVSELARSCSTAPGQRRGSGGKRLWVTVRRAVWLLGAALFAGPVWADGIVADGQAAAAQRPEVITTQNGLPQVNINAPNQAGVSHNPYQQFDVDARGAILNNSAVMTTTQLAGMIQGNPRLDPNATPARVIINEVNSDKPSQLQGYLEVAGGRAQVVVANPSGIVCNGCGTINAGRMTLTTGKPALNADGSLAGYRVERGVVSIEGGGLNGDVRHDTGYVDILARTVKVNAGVWAKAELAVVAGRNHISADSKTVTPLPTDGKPPELAIDMGQMGGMYSGYIRMIGTEAGVGVRNQGGHLQAGKTLTVSSEGRLSWQPGTKEVVTQAGGDISLTAREEIEHHGKLHSGGQLTVHSRAGGIVQSGTLAAAGDVRLTSAQGIQSSGHLLAGSDIHSTLKHQANLTLNSQGNLRASGSLRSLGDITLTGHRVDISQSQLAASRAEIAAQTGGVALQQAKIDSQQLAVKTPGNVDAQQAQVRAGRWEIHAASLFSQKAVWSQEDAGESRFALTGALDNTEGRIEAPRLSLKAGSLNNQQGRLVALGGTAQHWRVTGALNNRDGELGSNGSLRLETGSLDNRHGTVQSQSALHVTSGGEIQNGQQGKLRAGQALTLNASGDLDNTTGEMQGQHVDLTARRLTNAQGKVISQGRLQLNAGQGIDNQRGQLEAADALTIRTQGHGDNRGGTVWGGQVTFNAGHLNNRDGKLWAGQTLTLNVADAIENTAGNIKGEHLQLTAPRLTNTRGKVVSRGRLQLDIHQTLDNQLGWLEAGDALGIQSKGHWDNRGGTLQGSKQVTVNAGHLDNRDGKLWAGQALTLNATGDLDNTAGEMQGQHVDLTAQNLTNTRGKVLSLGRLQLAIRQALDNQHGFIEADDTLGLRTGGLVDNRDGKLWSGQALTLNTGGRLDNQRGRVQGTSTLQVTTGGDIQNDQGILLSGHTLTLNAAGNLHNTDGNLQSQSLDLTAQRLTNTRGKVVSEGNLQLKVRQGLDNQHGFIEAADTLTIHTDGRWDNRSGIAQGGKQVTVTAHDLDNHDGKLQSGGHLTLNSQGTVMNQAGTLTAKYDLRWQGGTSGVLNNDAGWLFSGGALSLQGGQLTNRQNGEIRGTQGLTLTLAGRWDNQGGKLISHGRSTVQAQTLLNAQGNIEGLDTLDMQFVRTLDNSTGRIFSRLAQSLRAENILNFQGWIGTLGGWSASGNRFDNREGRVLSQHDSTLAVNTLDNQQGTLTTAGALKLHVAQDIHNQAGKIGAGGRLDVQGATDGTAAGRVQNSGGTLLAEGDLAVTAQHVDNVDGLIDSQKGMRLTLSGLLDNRQGKLRSEENSTIRAQSLINTAGLVTSQQQLGLHILGLLNNTGGTVRSNGDQQITAGQVNNRQGKFNSQAALALTTGQLDNPDGTLISQGNSTYRVNVLNNQQGKIHSGGDLTFRGEQLHNQGGELVSTGVMRLDTTELNNQGQGKITSQAALRVHTDRLNNRDGGLLLGTTDTRITARELDNTAGRLHSAATLTLSLLDWLDNRQGTLLANHTFTLNADTPSTLTLLNQGGTVRSAAQLTVNAKTLDNRLGTLHGQQGLTLAVQQDYTHHAGDTLSSNGTLTFTVGGTLTNLADWLLAGNLTLNSTHFTNLGTLVGKTLQLTTGTLRNQRRLEADSLRITSDTLENTDTIMGDDITVHSRIIDNHGKEAVIAATGRLHLQAGKELTNQAGGLIYSGGALHLGSDGLIANRASRIEADGNVVIEANRLDNLREGLEIVRGAEKSETKWHRYNYYWRSYYSGENKNKATMAPTTQRLTVGDEAAVANNRYGTLLTIDAARKRAQVRVNNRDGQPLDLWVNYLALVPASDGGYDMTFYETRGEHQDWVPTPYHNTVWREHNRGRIEQWDPEKHLDIVNAPFVDDYNNFRERTATGTVTRDKLVSAGVGAHILAGGDMVLKIAGELLNDASTLSANRDLSAKEVGKITNRGYSVNEWRQETLVDHYDRDTRHWYPTFNHDETTALATIDAIMTGHGDVAINGTHLENTTVNPAQISLVEAAQKAAEAERAEWARNPLAVKVGDVAWQAEDVTLESVNPLTPVGRALTPGDPLQGDNPPLTPLSRPLTRQQRLDRVATSVPDNGLFRQHSAAGSPYLVVTDERFTSRGRFISSDYLLQRVGYDPAQVHKRLGDGFYEQRLVREQVLKLTGRPSVRGEDAMAQYQALMNNGIKVADDFRLVPGVRLTPAQIAALQQDIVWLVSETVETASGPQSVWVPKVYLANSTLRLTGQGALIGGGNLQLSANSLDNTGNLFAERALDIDAEQFRHQGGEIRADRIDVQAERLTLSTNLQDALRQASMSARDLSLRGGDIQLQGAKLDATQHLSLSARHNLAITAARSQQTGRVSVIAGAMGNRTRDGMEEAGQRMATVNGEWKQALGSTLNTGGDLSLSAGQDITLRGSQANAGGHTRLQAGGNVSLLAETTTNNTHLTANSRTSSVSNQREEERLHLTTVSGDQGVTLLAGDNLTAEGAQVDSRAGRIGLSAQSVTIKAARQRVADQDHEHKREGSTTRQRDMESVSERAVGSTFSGRDGVEVQAREGDITVTGSTLHSAQGALALQAKKDITLNSATESDVLFSESRSDKQGVLSQSRSQTVQQDRVTHEQGSLLSGNNIQLSAGHDLTVHGSAIAGEQDVTLQAVHDVAITAATETQSHYLREETKKSGLLSSGGIGFTVGTQSTRHEVDEAGTTQSQSVSTVGSSRGNVNITAGNQIRVGGADLVAGQDLTLTGDSVQIDPGYDKRRRTETVEQKQSGLTLALSGAVGSALNTAVSTARQAQKAGDSRLQALKGTQAVLSGAQGYQAYQLSEANSAKAEAINQAGGRADKPTDTVGIQLSYGSQSAKSETRQEATDSQGSTLSAGRDIHITATGDNAVSDQGGDIRVQGSGLKAGRDIALDAKRDIALVSAENTRTTRGENSSKGGSVGVGLTAGQGGTGIKFSASVNKGKGHEKGDGITHTETQLDAGHQVRLKTGQDALLKGAQVSGDTVTVDVGRNLHLASEQDKDNYDSKQENISAGASFTYGSMNGSASVNASRDKLHSQFESVKEQTGIFAGKGGFDVKVGEHTQLDGAVIASTAEKDKNRLETGTLGFSDIENKAEYQSEHQSVGLSTSGSMGSQMGTNMASTMLASPNKSDSQSSTTQAAVSDGTIIVRDADKQQQDVATLSRDTDNAANSLTPIFDKEKEQQRLAQAQAIASIGTQVMDIYNTQEALSATKKATAALQDPQQQPRLKQQAEAQLRKENQAITPETMANLAHQIAYNEAIQAQGADIGGNRRQAVTAVVTALQGLTGGDIKAAIAGGAAPYLANAVKDLTYGNKAYEQLTAEEKATNLAAHAILGGVIAEMKGGSATAGAVGAASGELAASTIANALYPDKKLSELSPDEKEKISNLATLAGGIAAGLATDSTAGGVAGAQGAKNAVESNYLYEDDSRNLDKGLAECKAKGGDCGAVIQKYLDISNKNSAELEEKCSGGGITCVTYEELVQASTNVALDEGSLQIRLSEKLKDPDAIKIVQYLNGKDLQFLKDNITTSNRVAAVALDPTSWPVMVFGAKAMIQGAKGKEQLIAAGVTSGMNAAIQYGTTKEVKLSDLIGAGVVGAITAGKGYNPTVTWNAVGGYYTAEIKGDDPFLNAVLSKGGASAGYAAGNVIKVPMQKVLNPISKQYKWEPIGIWTITKPVKQSSVPSVAGNVGDSAVSGWFNSTVGGAMQEGKQQNEKK